MHGVTIEKARYKTVTRKKTGASLDTDEPHVTFHVDPAFVDG